MPDPFRPASERLGLREPDLLIEGLPSHMRSAIAKWLSQWLDSYETDGAVAAHLMNLGHVPPRTREEQSKRTGEYEVILMSDRESIDVSVRGDSDSTRVLDMLDWALSRLSKRGAENLASQLRTILERGGSRWTVGASGQSIETRVADEEAAEYTFAITPADEAAKDLAEAWRNTYGTHPDPSDAWDHAIKAVEWLLPGAVAPDDLSPRLGKLLDVMRSKPEKWVFKLDTTDKEVTAVRTMTAMMGLVWGNPDRHGAGSSRPPTQAEAEAIVRMAVTVVGLLRSNTLEFVR